MKQRKGDTWRRKGLKMLNMKKIFSGVISGGQEPDSDIRISGIMEKGQEVCI
jgi:hypothetical protein